MLEQTMTRGWTTPCHPPAEPAHAQGHWGCLAGEGPGAPGCLLPQVEQHIRLLVQNHLDVAGVDLMVIHSIPLPIAGLWKNMGCGQAVSKENRARLWPGTLLACRAAGTAPIIRSALPKNPDGPGAGQGALSGQPFTAAEHSLCPMSSAPHHPPCQAPSFLHSKGTHKHLPGPSPDRVPRSILGSPSRSRSSALHCSCTQSAPALHRGHR